MATNDSDRDRRGRNDDGRKPSSDELEREIRETRAQIDHTLDELESRLSPGQIFDQAVSYFRRNGPPRFARNLGSDLRENPLPVMVTAAGIAWLMYASSHPHRGEAYETYGYGEGPDLGERIGAASERAGSRLAGARERGREAAHQIRDAGASAAERAGRLTEGASHAASRVRSGTSYRARRMRQGFERTLDEEPLLAGVASFAVGALIGAMLPPTRSEDEAFGEARDRTLQRAAETGIEKTREVAETVKDKAREVGREQRGQRQERGGDGRDTRPAPGASEGR